MNFDNLKQKGTLFIITAPSGSGKSTLIHKAIDSITNLNFSISYTTREKRKGEENGKDYFFVSEADFLQMVNEDKFLEYAKVFDKYYYGTSKAQVEAALKNGKDIIMDIDVQGACQLMKKQSLPHISIFILPPSFKELENRLVNRKRDSESEIQKRLKVAENEIKYISRFDYLIINGDINKSSDDFLSIIKSERLKINNIDEPKLVIDIIKE